MTWPGTPPDTEAGKPNTTGPNESANTPPPKQPAPTNESPTQPQDATTAGQNEWQPSTERPTQHVIQDIQIGTPPTPTSATPDTDSPPSDDHDTASANSSNHHADTDPPPSDASDANHKSATANGHAIALKLGTSGWRSQLIVDGHDISRSVRAVTITSAADQLTTVTLDLAMVNVIVEGETPRLWLPLSTRELLRRFGWTPPDESRST